MSKGIGIAVLGFGLLGLGWWAHGHHGPRIQDHVRHLAETAVAPSIHGATATVSGRDIHLSGIADSKAEAAHRAGCTVVQVPDVGQATGRWAHHLARDLIEGAARAGLIAPTL